MIVPIDVRARPRYILNLVLENSDLGELVVLTLP